MHGTGGNDGTGGSTTWVIRPFRSFRCFRAFSFGRASRRTCSTLAATSANRSRLARARGSGLAPADRGAAEVVHLPLPSWPTGSRLAHCLAREGRAPTPGKRSARLSHDNGHGRECRVGVSDQPVNAQWGESLGITASTVASLQRLPLPLMRRSAGGWVFF